MKKVTAKKSATGTKRKPTASNRASIGRRGIDTTNYARVISYIVKSEENETEMMIAATGSTQS